MDYQVVCEAAREFDETNDCSVKAVAIATGIDYPTVRNMFKKHGREDRKGTYHSTFAAALKELGFTFEVIHFESKTMKKIEWELIWKKRLIGIPAVIESTKHHAAWDGRHIQDWSADRRKRVKCGYVLKRIEA